MQILASWAWRLMPGEWSLDWRVRDGCGGVERWEGVRRSRWGGGSGAAGSVVGKGERKREGRWCEGRRPQSLLYRPGPVKATLVPVLPTRRQNACTCVHACARTPTHSHTCAFFGDRHRESRHPTFQCKKTLEPKWLRKSKTIICIWNPIHIFLLSST